MLFIVNSRGLFQFSVLILLTFLCSSTIRMLFAAIYLCICFVSVPYALTLPVSVNKVRYVLFCSVDI